MYSQIIKKKGKSKLNTKRKFMQDLKKHATPILISAFCITTTRHSRKYLI